MATTDNIISDFIDGYNYLFFIKYKQNEEQYHDFIRTMIIQPSNFVFSSSNNIKHYIKIGSECPICYEKIFTNKNAFINKCGHYYHASCIFEYIKIRMDNHIGECPCSMCRSDVEYDDLYLNEKYKKNINFIDKLENFYNNPFQLNYKYCKKCKRFFSGLECINH